MDVTPNSVTQNSQKSIPQPPPIGAGIVRVASYLGTTNFSVVGDGKKAQKKAQNPQLKQDMLQAVKDLLPLQNKLQACQAHPTKGGLPGHKYAANVDRVMLLDVCRCDNPHLCPHCGPIVADKKSKIVHVDLQVWEWEGYTACSVTLTLQHFLGEALAEVDRRYSQAFKKMLDSKPGRAFKAKWHIVGRQINPDVTVTVANGWHRHGNNIFYLERRPLSDVEIAEFIQELTALWCDYVKQVGGFADQEHGVKVRFGSIFDVADYMASKAMGCGGAGVTDPNAAKSSDKWGLPEEITKSYLKNRGQGASPTQLIMAYLWEDDPRFSREMSARLFQEYAQVFSGGGKRGKGKKFLETSSGFRKILDDLRKKYADKIKALGEEINPEWSPRLTWFSHKAWAQLVAQEAVYWFRDEARLAGSDVSKVKEFLDDCEITEVWYPTIQPDPPDWWVAYKLGLGDVDPVAIDLARGLDQAMRDYNNGVV